MMAYAIPSFPSTKELLASCNAIQIHNFKLNKENLELKIYPVSRVPRIVFRPHFTQYTKELIALQGTTDSIAMIKKNGEFHSFVWHTTADKLKEATRWGIVKTQSVTGQVIASLGHYRLITMDRIKDGLISNRYELKEALLSHYQDRFEELATLESLANQDFSKKKFLKAFNGYISKLIKIKDNSAKEMHDEIQADIDEAEQFKWQCSARSTGVDSVLTFVKTQMIRNLHEMQNRNQNITYNREIYFAATRGDLNSCIEDAQKAIEDYNAPPRDSVSADHHGHYGAGKDSVTFDSSFHCTTPQQEQHTLLAITFIEKMNEISKMHGLRIVYATKWAIGGGLTVAVKKIAAWFANVSIKFFVGIFELPLTLLVEPLTFGNVKALRFFQWVRELATFELPVESPAPQLKGSELLTKARRHNNSLGLRLRHLVANAFKNTVQDILFGMRDTYKKFAIHLFDDMYDDYADGKNKKRDLDYVLKKVEGDFKKIDQHIEIVWDKIFPAEGNAWKKIFPDLDKRPDINELISAPFASPEFIPGDGEFDNDPLNAFATGIDTVMAFHMHNIHAKNPFAGLLFNFFYLVGGLAILAPNAVSFLGPQLIAAIQKLGFGMSSNPVAAAGSGGCTMAQAVALIGEFIMHGPKSLIATGAVEFEKDPFTSLIYVATALAFGDLIVRLNIPWLSKTLLDDAGTVPQSSLVFVVAKVGFLVYEVFMESGHAGFEKVEKEKKLRDYLTDLYKKSHPDPVDQAVVTNEIDSIINTLFENADSLKQSYQQLKNQNTDLSEQNKKKIERASLISFLNAKRNRLQYLSPKRKHQLVRQLNERFSPPQVRSLKKWLYPEEHTSIFRTTLGIIISYPAFLVRLAVACVSSIIWRNTKPLQSAGTDFGLKILKDITRVGRACSKLFKTTASFFRRQGKTVADVFVNSFLARSEALIANSHHIANKGYKISAKIDQWYEMARQWFSTLIDLAIKKVTVAHPLDTERKTKESYFKLLQELAYKKQQPGSELAETKRIEPSPSNDVQIKKLALAAEKIDDVLAASGSYETVIASNRL